MLAFSPAFPAVIGLGLMAIATAILAPIAIAIRIVIVYNLRTLAARPAGGGECLIPTNGSISSSVISLV